MWHVTSHALVRSSALLLAFALPRCQSPRVTFLQLTVEPAQLSFMTESPSPPVDQIVTVTNTGESLIHISSIKPLVNMDDGSGTDVFHYEAATGNTTLALSVAPGLDGAGVSPRVQVQ
jgi:hypothetical protein